MHSIIPKQPTSASLRFLSTMVSVEVRGMRKITKSILLAGLPFGLLMGTIYVFQFTLRPSVDFDLDLLLLGAVVGIANGVFFGGALSLFSYYQGKKFAAEDPSAPGEELIMQGGANHFLRGEGVGGYLYLTNERLIFKSHKFNFQRHELTILIREVDSARSYLILGLIPIGLEVVTSDRKERFVVAKRHNWLQGIRRVRQQESSG